MKAERRLAAAVVIPAVVILGGVPSGLMAGGPHRTSASSPAADTVSTRCAGSALRQFDFWLGRWTVRDRDGTEAGRSEITRVSGGCAILERWEGADGVRGTSLNVYDRKAGRWSQLWVGGHGLVLRLQGGREGDSMVLSGRHRTPDGRVVLDRIRWTPLAGGGVRQTWEMSRDGGATWTLAFDGRYAHR